METPQIPFPKILEEMESQKMLMISLHSEKAQFERRELLITIYAESIASSQRD